MNLSSFRYFPCSSLHPLLLSANLLCFHFSSRLDNLNLKQEEDKTEKIQRWEIWIIRIRELLDKCKGKMKDLKSKGEPQNKKDVREQIVLAEVRTLYVCMFV